MTAIYIIGALWLAVAGFGISVICRMAAIADKARDEALKRKRGLAE